MGPVMAKRRSAGASDGALADEYRSCAPDGAAFIDNTPPLPRRTARRQAEAPDPRSRRGAAAEVGPALAGAGTIPQADVLPARGLPCPPTDVWSLNLPPQPDSHGADGPWGRRLEWPHPHSASNRSDVRSVPPRTPRGVGEHPCLRLVRPARLKQMTIPNASSCARLLTPSESRGIHGVDLLFLKLGGGLYLSLSSRTAHRS